MQTINQISKRIGLFILVYIGLLMLVNITDFKSIYHQHFIKMNNVVFASFSNGGLVTFKDGPTIDQQKYKAQDSKVTLRSQQQKKIAVDKARKAGKTQASFNPVSFDLNSWDNFGFLISFFLALAIALPLGWKRKLFTFITGYVLIQLFFYIKMWVLLNLKFSIWHEKFHVGWTNDFFIDLLNYFHLIIKFPFFGLLLITLIGVLLNSRSLVQLQLK